MTIILSIITLAVLIVLYFLLKKINTLCNNVEITSTKVNGVYNNVDQLTCDIYKKEINDDLSRTRLELMMLIKYFPENETDIEKLGYKYFVELGGDSYMYNLYLDWVNNYESSPAEWFKRIVDREEDNNR